MAETTITITEVTNPTYGGFVSFDGIDVYARQTLADQNPSVSADLGGEIWRAFAFFDLSTDPTSGGTITKVELLATVNSVSGTHAVDFWTGDENFEGGNPSSDPDIIFDGITGSKNSAATGITPSAGSLVQDLGTAGLSDLQSAVTDGTFFGAYISLSNEGTAGSVVFDAATGFGLKITYTPAASGPGTQARIMTLGVG